MTDWLSYHHNLAVLTMFLSTGALVLLAIGAIGVGVEAGGGHPLPGGRGKRAAAGALALLIVAASVAGVVVSGNAINRGDARNDSEIRSAILATYAVSIQKWGQYYSRAVGEELTSLWRVDGENTTCTVTAMEHADDPILLVCGGRELPKVED